MGKMSLTPRMSETYEKIREFIREKGHGPTVRDVAAMLGLKSTSGAHRMLAGLQSRGWIRIEHNKARAITLLGEAANDQPKEEKEVDESSDEAILQDDDAGETKIIKTGAPDVERIKALNVFLSGMRQDRDLAERAGDFCHAVAAMSPFNSVIVIMSDRESGKIMGLGNINGPSEIAGQVAIVETWLEQAKKAVPPTVN